MSTANVPSGSGGGLLDPKAVGTLRQLGLVSRLFPAYMEVMPGQVEALRAALGARDAPEARRLSHRLRGSSAQLGAAALAQLLGEIEAAAEAREADLARWDASLRELVAGTLAALRLELDASG